MKKTSKKRVAAFALALAMACTSMPVSMETVWAEEIEGTGETEGTEVCESHIYGENGYCTSCSQKLLVSVTTADENLTTSYYTDFALAIEEAVKNENAGCTVTLLSDISLNETVRISSGNFTLDLDKYILKYSESYALNISGGTIDIIAQEGGKIKGYNGICIYGGTVKVAASIEATDSDGNAIYIGGGNLTVSGGTIKGNYGIYGDYGVDSSIVIEESANIEGSNSGIKIENEKNRTELEITGGMVSGKNNAIRYCFYNSEIGLPSIIISGGTISCGEGGGCVFYDDLYGGSTLGSLILKGGSYPNGIILGEFCRDLSEMLGENYVCLDSDGNVVALTQGEKNYSTIRSIVEDKEPPIVQYQIGEQEAVPLSDDEAEISIVEGEELAFSASDRLIGMGTISYHISTTEITNTDTISQESWQEYSEALKLEKSNGCYLYVQAKDKLNNTTVHAIKFKFIPEITDIPTISGTYGQSLSEMTLSKTEGESDDEIQGTWSITHANKEHIYPSVGTNEVYEVTFTPTDASYNTVTKSTTVTVSKATPRIVENPTPEEITYGQPLSDSSLKDGKVQCSETNQTLVEGTFTWGDASRVPSVSDSNVTEFEVVFTPSDTTNYDITTTNVKITVNKIENVPNRPQSSMNVSHKYIKIDDVPLPNGWEWKEEDKEQELKDGQEITATAQYTAEDKVEYSNLEIKITVTRSECEHTEGAVVWDGTVDTDVAPTCEREGYGHTTCTKCGNVVKSGIHVQGLEHKYKSEITKKATYTEEGIRTYTCTQPGCTKRYTKVIEKLKRPSYSGNSGNSGSTTNPPTTEEPSTEEPSTQEPTTEEPSTEEPSTQEPSTDESTKDEPTTKEPDSTEENPIDWKQDENGVFYEKEDGTKATGWYEMEDGDWYYFNEDGYRQTGWEKDGDTWYYLNETGVMQTGWQKDGESWYYLSESGAMQTGWQKDGEKWYYLSESGAMQTGWQKDGESWYYLSENGSMQTGWQKDGESWYYLSGSGAMQTGWLKEGGSWYYLSESGAMQIGWLKDGETWYYLNASGSMKTGWLQIGADWFYLNANGSMAADTYIGIWYVDKNGYYIPSKTK